VLLLTPVLQLYARDRYGAACSVAVCTDIGAAAMAQMFAVLLTDARGPAVLALSQLTRREVSAFCANGRDAFGGEMASGLGELPEGAPMPGLTIFGGGVGDAAMLDANDLRWVEQQQREWVDRALSPGPLRLCPYTASSSMAGAGLEAQGVQPAPIAYHTSAARTAPALLGDFWRATHAMVEGGEAATSSIILSAPAWDGRWLEWRDEVGQQTL